MSKLRLTFSILATLITLSTAPGAVTSGSSSSSANAAYQASLGSLNLSGSLAPTSGSRLKERQTIQDSDEQDDNSLEALFKITLLNESTAHNPDGGYLFATGRGKTSLTIAARGTWNPDETLTPSGSISSEASGNENSYTFTIDSEQLEYTFSGTISGDTSAQVSIALETLDPDLGWQPILEVQSINDTFYFSEFLQPGDYRVRASIDLSVSFPEQPTKESFYTYALTVGTAPVETYIPEEGEYTYPEIGTDLTNSPKLTITNPTIVSEISQGDGTTAVQVRAGLANSSLSPWIDLYVTIPTEFPDGPTITLSTDVVAIFDSELRFNDAAPESTATLVEEADTLTAIVPDADLATFRASILDGSRFTTRGRELWVFIYPVEIVDAYWAERLESELTTAACTAQLIFDGPPGFTPGTLYIEHEAISAIPLLREPLLGGILDPTSGGKLSQGFDRFLPLLVTGVNERNNIYCVYGKFLTFLETIKHGTVITTIDPKHPSGLLPSEGFTGDALPKSTPLHFNRLPISDYIELSGSFLFNPGPLSVELEMSFLQVKTLLVHTSFQADATLLVETKGAADNTGEPITKQEKELLSFPLFSLTLPAGFTVTPELSVNAGAAVNAPTGISVPIETSLQINAVAGFKNGQAFYEQDIVETPPHISLPAIHEQLQADISAWIATQLLVRIGLPESALGVGPTIGARIGGTFNVDPLGADWWTLDGDLKLTAGVELDFADIITFVDEERVLATKELFHLDSNGPLLAEPIISSLELPNNPGIRPLEGKSTRWARALRPIDATSVSETNLYIHTLVGSPDFIAGSDNDLSRFSPDGTLQWTLAITPGTKRSVPSPDGGFTVLSGRDEHDLAHYDADGNRLWQTSFGPVEGSIAPIDLVSQTSENLTTYFAAGWRRGFTLDDTWPILIKFDATGAILWSKTYTLQPVGGEAAGTGIERAYATADGNIVLVGGTVADIASGQTGKNTVNVNANGFVMKVDAQTGEVIWTTLLAYSLNAQLLAITEDPDGNLYIGGGQVVGVLDDAPALTVSKLAADGSLIDSILIGSAFGENAQEIPFDANPVPHRGEGAFDQIRSMAWIDGALWIGGKIGSPGISSVSDGQSAFTARLTPDLGVTRFAIHAGRSTDFIGAIADGGDGLLAVGYSRSFLPWPSGATEPEAGTPASRLVMKLPWEGLLRFHDNSAAAQDDRESTSPISGSYFVYPRSIAASDTTIFSARFYPESLDPDAPDTLVAADTVPIAVTDLPLRDAYFPPAAPPLIVPISYNQIEYVPSEIVDNFATYLAYHQLDPQDDSDQDGIPLTGEFFLGTDPTQPNVASLLEIHQDTFGDLYATLPRSSIASQESMPPPVEWSLDLQNWEPLANDQIQFDLQPDGSDLFTFQPLLDLEEPAQFYRINFDLLNVATPSSREKTE